MHENEWGGASSRAWPSPSFWCCRLLSQAPAPLRPSGRQPSITPPPYVPYCTSTFRSLGQVFFRGFLHLHFGRTHDTPVIKAQQPQYAGVTYQVPSMTTVRAQQDAKRNILRTWCATCFPPGTVYCTHSLDANSSIPPLKPVPRTAGDAATVRFFLS